MASRSAALTPMQQRFVEEYLVDLNGAPAAERAGHAKSRARQTASELLEVPAIIAAVQSARTAQSHDTSVVRFALGRLRARHRLDATTVPDLGRDLDLTPLLRPGTRPFEVDEERIGLLHVSEVAPSDGQGWTLVVLFHGAGADAADIIPVFADVPLREPTLVLAPDSVASSWGLIHGQVGADLRRLDAALELLLQRVHVARERTAVAGFSDGASYALSVGLANGELLPNVIAFSPGFVSPPRISGQPRFFISHGTSDRVLSIDRCSRVIVPRLRGAGYDVDYREFRGGHTVPEPMVEAALDWLGAAPARLPVSSS